jgi:hypothetical protein
MLVLIICFNQKINFKWIFFMHFKIEKLQNIWNEIHLINMKKQEKTRKIIDDDNNK